MKPLSFFLRGPQIDLTHPETPNAFDALRFFAATCVLVSHSWPLTGRRAEPFPGGWDTLGGLGVGVFFVISGFLVTASRERSASMASFLHKRALRIVPAFALVCVFSVFIFGPLLTTLPLDAYFDHPQTRIYFVNVTMSDVQLALPGVFADNAYPHAVNGSTWTLPIECFMYLLLAVAGVLFLERWLVLLMTLTAIVALQRYGLQWAEGGSHLWATLPAYYTAMYGIFFGLGSCAYAWRNRLPLSPALSILLWLIALFLRQTGFAMPSYMLALAYSTLTFAALPWRMLTNWGRYGDFSYGLYLFAFPVQQMVVHYLGVRMPLAPYIVLCFIITLGFAFVSWHAIERPALALKPTAHLRAPTL